jgi:DNA polymerase-3 subunit beta
VIDRDELLRGVNAVLDIVPSKTALPVLSNILVDVSETEGIRFSATDLDISILCGVSASVEVPGSTTVPARKFAEIVRELPEEAVELHAESERVTIKRQGGAEGTYALMSVSADDFPDLPGEIEGPDMAFSGTDEASEDGHLLRDMIFRTAFAVSRDETRPVLNGVLWQVGEGRMTMVATDGARLVKYSGTDEASEDGHLLRDMIFRTAFAVSRDETRPVLNGVLWQVGEGRMTMVATDGARLVKYSKAMPASPSGGGTEAIVPTRALNHLVKLMSAGGKLDRVQFGQNHLMFSLSMSGANGTEGGGGIRLFSRLIEGPYVDYEQVIPQANGKRLKVSNSLLSPAVRRVSILSSSQNHQVRFRLNANEIELSATSQEIGGEAREVLEADYNDEEMAIGYNSAYLQDILRRIDSEQVMFELDSPVTAGIIRPADQPEGEDYLCLLMPLRLSD